jgi:16S rRNA (guanine527-N7)-methyltransferase
LNFEPISRYFPQLSEHQVHQFEQLGPLYREWNARINVISRKDIENLYERHVLHSLGIAKVIDFMPGTKILDAGTGGGFPGIPLAILFPQAHFHLVDSTAKKLTVVKTISREIALKNISTEYSRLEVHRGVYDFIVSRAVTSLPEFFKLVSHLISDINKNAIPNGILYLKGGDVKNELELLNRKYKIIDLSTFFEEEFFLTKKVLHIY